MYGEKKYSSVTSERIEETTIRIVCNTYLNVAGILCVIKSLTVCDY